MTPPRALLLDTNAAIWLASGQLPLAVVELVSGAAANGGVHVSTVSAWEIGLLARPRTDDRPGPRFLPDPASWFASLTSRFGIRVERLTASAAIASSSLPAGLHDDPADRLLVATARELSIPIVTGDRKIIAYGKAGHVSAIACQARSGSSRLASP